MNDLLDYDPLDSETSVALASYFALVIAKLSVISLLQVFVFVLNDPLFSKVELQSSISVSLTLADITRLLLNFQ